MPVAPPTHGGGAKKVLYTLATARRIGLQHSAKALRANNTCKACGLGMGGQLGGMTNELGEFPSVCNKSVQAQSTDIQPPIPSEVFNHSVLELAELSGHELEHLGRLGTPLIKSAGGQRFEEVSWDTAMNRAASAFLNTTPQRSFFYSSGRSSNEAGFVLQLLARLYGTNNISNCSYYCHQATSEALDSTIGSGTATVELNDLAECDLLILAGANPASNHPRLLHKLIELRRRGGKVVVINPLKEPGLMRFAAPKLVSSLIKGGDDIASLYVQPRAGTDRFLFVAVAKLLLERGAIDDLFIERHTAGFEQFKTFLDAQSLVHLSSVCGVSTAELSTLADVYAGSQKTVFAWGMGMTHHLQGVQNIEWLSNLALLRGMVGQRGAGLLPLRGHSNVQGIGTIGVKPVLPAEVFRRIESAFDVQLPKVTGLHTLASLQAAHDGVMDVALLMGGNLYEATPDTAFAARAFDRIGTKVFMTTTLNKGHVHGAGSGEVIILPVCARDEEPEATTQESMFNYVRMSDGGIERIATVRSESAVLCELAKQLVPDCPVDFSAFSGHDNVREAIARVIPGMEDLQDLSVAKREFHVRGRLLHTPSFQTHTGKAHFVIPEGALAAPADEPQHPFTLMSIRSEGQFNSIIYEDEDSYRGVTQRWSVLMNRDDVRTLGLHEGAKVDVRSTQGVMCGVSVVAFDVPAGCVAAYYPEANVLTSTASDPRSHTPAFKSVSVSIVPSGV